MSAAASQRFGHVLDSMNRGALRGYADGGMIGASAGPVSSRGGGPNVHIHDHHTNVPPVQHRTTASGDQVIDIRDMFQKGIKGNASTVRDAVLSTAPKVTRAPES